MIVHYIKIENDKPVSYFIEVMEGTCILFGLTQIACKDTEGVHHDIKFTDLVSIGN